jgi:acetyl esterase/lipase
MKTRIFMMALMSILGCSALIRVAETVETQAVVDRKATPLWPSAAPGALGGSEKDIPLLTTYLPVKDKATGIAVIVCPGGGYGGLAMDHEGIQIAEWLNSIGAAAFILKYRLPANGYRHPVPLMDSQRAIRLVRSQAERLNVKPDRIGILGFSAGGHLASTAATHFENPVPTGGDLDSVDALSCRPDFQILIYPVISMDGAITHHGSRNNLLGPDPSEVLLKLLSNELQITPKTPPAFLVHANDDKAVLPENSIRYYLAMQKAGVPAELHIYLKGGHGFGIRPATGPAAKWTDRCTEWLVQTGLINSAN